MSSIERDWLAAEQSLTEAEWEVVTGIANGHSVARIADWLGISTGTVRTHIYHVAHKLPEHNGLTGYTRILYWVVKQPITRKIAA